MHMQQIRNQLGEFGVGQRGADDAWLAVMQRAHGVIEMGETGRTGIECGNAFLVTAEGVADLHAHATAAQLTDQTVMAGDFRGDGDHADRRQCQVFFDFGHQCGVGEVRLRAEFAGVDVRAFEVYAEDSRGTFRTLFAELSDFFQDAGDLGARRGHGGGQQRGGAETHVGSGDGLEGAGAFHDVFATAAVDVQIDETRQQIRQVIVGRIAGHAFDRHDFAVFVDQPAANPAAGGKDVVFGHFGSRFWPRLTTQLFIYEALQQSRSSRCGNRCR
ncbi:hypothetical protein D3C87_1379320 [compost metagenome]